MMGKVFLVGAGPGDPKLLTLRAAELLKDADVVLYDGLVNEEILHLANPNAISICVGKRGHGGTWTQERICDTTIEYARSHERVVRLKGGDTAIFARVVEEIEGLRSHGIECEIVPGITVASAVTAYAGIPLTHRDWSSAIAFVTAQTLSADGYTEGEEAFDWRSMASFPGTIALYMGATNAESWSRQLIEAGRSPNTPVAMVRRCSFPDQKVLVCTLSTAAATLIEHPDFSPPIITIIGDVVRNSLNTNKP